MFRKFEIKGNRAHIRVYEELTEIDKLAADEAFKKYKKMILDEYLVSKGFIKYKTNGYVRKNKIDILEYIDLQKERHGSKTFTVNYALMPLYVPHDYMVIGFGDRIGIAISNRDIWWDYANESIAKISFQNVVEAIDKFVLPWFEKYSNEKKLIKKLLEDKKKKERKGLGVTYKNKEWLESLERCEDRSSIISGNIEKLKLPQKLLGEI